MTMVLTNPKERGRFLRFMVVGVVGAVVDFGTFNLLTGFAKVPAVLASVCSFMAAVVSNFLWNRYWTYPDSRTKPLGHQVLQFTGISLAGLAIRTPLFAFLESRMGVVLYGVHLPVISQFNPDFLAHNTALAMAVIVVMFWNFFVNRYWTYNDVE
jgi:putative flippase GtrA